MNRTRNSFWTLPQPQKYPIRARKSKKLSQNQIKKVRIEEDKSCSST